MGIENTKNEKPKPHIEVHADFPEYMYIENFRIIGLTGLSVERKQPLAMLVACKLRQNKS